VLETVIASIVFGYIGGKVIIAIVYWFDRRGLARWKKSRERLDSQPPEIPQN
jgi:hypothetical protein